MATRDVKGGSASSVIRETQRKTPAHTRRVAFVQKTADAESRGGRGGAGTVAPLQSEWKWCGLSGRQSGGFISVSSDGPGFHVSLLDFLSPFRSWESLPFPREEANV